MANPSVGNLLYIWFIIGGALCTGLVLWLGKETLGLTLEEIDLLYATEEYKAKHAQEAAVQQQTLASPDKISDKDLEATA